MSLVISQALHAHRTALLILHAEQLGYVVTLGDCYRDPRCPYGIKDSKHKRRLATDLNLFSRDKDGEYTYLTKTIDHKTLGEYWESIGGIWGGRFSEPDGNHYESPE